MGRVGKVYFDVDVDKIDYKRRYEILYEAYELLVTRYSELACEKREIERRLMEQETINTELRQRNSQLELKFYNKNKTIGDIVAEWEEKYGPIKPINNL